MENPFVKKGGRAVWNIVSDIIYHILIFPIVWYFSLYINSFKATWEYISNYGKSSFDDYFEKGVVQFSVALFPVFFYICYTLRLTLVPIHAPNTNIDYFVDGCLAFLMSCLFVLLCILVFGFFGSMLIEGVMSYINYLKKKYGEDFAN